MQTAAPKHSLPTDRVKSQREGWARNMLELSAALQVSTRQISNAANKHVALCPGKTEDGYEIEAWRTFFWKVKATDDEAYAEAKLEKLNLENYRTEQQAELFRIKRELEEGKIAYRSDVIDTVCCEMLPGLISVLQAAKWEIANAGYGQSREDLAELVEAKIAEALGEMAKGSWTQKKTTFWLPLYAKLSPLLPKSSSGVGRRSTSAGSKTESKSGTRPRGRPFSGRSSTRSATTESTKLSASVQRKAAKQNSATSSSASRSQKGPPP